MAQRRRIEARGIKSDGKKTSFVDASDTRKKKKEVFRSGRQRRIGKGFTVGNANESLGSERSARGFSEIQGC